MGFYEIINKLYYETSMVELYQMNNKDYTSHISHNTLLYLDTIGYIPGCTISKLAERLNISKPAATMKVNEMMKQGLIEKKQSDVDKRVYYLYLKEDIRKTNEIWDDALKNAEKYLYEKYSEEEMNLVVKVLNDGVEKYVGEVDHGYRDKSLNKRT